MATVGKQSHYPEPLRQNPTWYENAGDKSARQKTIYTFGTTLIKTAKMYYPFHPNLHPDKNHPPN